MKWHDINIDIFLISGQGRLHSHHKGKLTQSLANPCRVSVSPWNCLEFSDSSCDL